MSVRALGATLVSLSLAAGVASCGDPAPLPRVHVTISNLHDTLPNSRFDSSSVSIDVLFPGTGDGGTTLRRAVYWDHSDTFDFFVQIPAGAYGPPRFEAHGLIDCHTVVTDLVLAEGHAASGFAVSASGPNEAPTMMAVIGTQTCP